MLGSDPGPGSVWVRDRVSLRLECQVSDPGPGSVWVRDKVRLRLEC